MAVSSAKSLRDLALFLAAFTAVWIAYVVVVWKFGWLPDEVRPAVRTAIWCGAVVVWVLWQKPVRPLAWLGLAPVTIRHILWTLAAFVAILAWNVLRVSVLSQPTDRLASLALAAYATSLVGVFVEELLFRGVVQTRLSERSPTPLAVPVAALLFSAIHVPGWIILAIPVDAGTAVSVFLIGVICGALRYWSGSLWPAVGAHWANNLGALL